MKLFYDVVLAMHATLGIIGLIVFWVPAVSPKGGRLHRQLGRLFIRTMYAVAVSGIVVAGLLYWNPLSVKSQLVNATGADVERMIAACRETSSFLMVLAILLLNNAHQAVVALRSKRDRTVLRRPLNLALLSILAVAGAMLAVRGAYAHNTIHLVFAGISLLVSVNSLWYAVKRIVRPDAWLFHHVGNTIGAGIAAHTAFLVFGARQWTNDLFPGAWQMMPWLLPSLLGVIAIIAVNVQIARNRVLSIP